MLYDSRQYNIENVLNVLIILIVYDDQLIFFVHLTERDRVIFDDSQLSLQEFYIEKLWLENKLLRQDKILNELKTKD
jgi:hypothetical protein